MKSSLVLSGLALTLSLSALAADFGPKSPAPCSVSIGVVPRLGLSYRTWTNALETGILEDLKGLKVCQDDVSLSMDEVHSVDLDVRDADARKMGLERSCESEFLLELVYRKDKITRYITLSKNGRELYTADYQGDPNSQKILRQIPTCAELQKL